MEEGSIGSWSLRLTIIYVYLAEKRFFIDLYHYVRLRMGLVGLVEHFAPNQMIGSGLGKSLTRNQLGFGSNSSHCKIGAGAADERNRRAKEGGQRSR